MLGMCRAGMRIVAPACARFIVPAPPPFPPSPPSSPKGTVIMIGLSAGLVLATARAAEGESGWWVGGG